jgi:hypothetical protein
MIPKQKLESRKDFDASEAWFDTPECAGTDIVDCARISAEVESGLLACSPDLRQDRLNPSLRTKFCFADEQFQINIVETKS